ncbi:hypothetical protein K474DRAFT_1677270 [Panus rudis PR-1116 ss-1]|nr:hypothetical protein K474DRAFT_1677270 [Panus rudis PR-1116 ss-1]
MSERVSQNVASKETQSPMPKWLPISLLALTTAALAVPLVYLRRQKATMLSETLRNGPPPPPRRNVASSVSRLTASTSRSNVPPIRQTSSRGTTKSPPTVTPSQNIAAEGATVATASTDLDGPFLAAKAFGIATLFVGVGAVITVTGVKAFLGVENTQQFADCMRKYVLLYMPALSSRIHRPLEPADVDPNAPSNIALTNSTPSPSEKGDAEWTWSAAEERLRNAFEKDGIVAWAETAIRELEAEGQLERTKRNRI